MLTGLLTYVTNTEKLSELITTLLSVQLTVSHNSEGKVFAVLVVISDTKLI